MNIKISGLSKAFGAETVLDGISLDADFETLAVIGPSGGGKSTLLRILGGLLLPDAGQVFIDGKEIPRNEKQLSAYRRDIGFVFQSKGLFGHMTALENVTAPLIHTFGVSRAAATETANGLFARFGLYESRGKYPHQLSGGQQQRIAIARAVAVKPKLLLLDEPTSALDPQYTGEVFHMLRELQEDGLNTIIVTHVMEFAKTACGHVLFLANSKIAGFGESADMLNSPKPAQIRDFLNGFAV